MIIVDESESSEEPPVFPFRDVSMRKGVSIRGTYEILEEIGRGKFGLVYRCREKNSKLILAAKIVSTKRREDRQNVEREAEIMRKLQHPRVIQLFDAIEDTSTKEMCLVLEMIHGGELFDRVIEDEFILTEKACTIFVRQICEAMEYIHSKGVIHLDMKPENVMCLSKQGNRIKIIDFGLARMYDPSKNLQILFGTPEFVAPEVVNFEAISYATDMWSVGVIAYVLVSGLSPFMGDNDIETMANVTIAKYEFDDESFDDISDEAKDFIASLLMKDKSQRMTAEQCLKHCWLAPSTKGSLRNSSSSVLTNDSDIELNNVGSSCSDDESHQEDLLSDKKNAPCDIQVEPATPTPVVVIKHPLATTQTKRPSLDIPKNRLKDFVNQWTDNPYMFDSPRGIITNMSSNGELLKSEDLSNGELLGKSFSDISHNSFEDPDSESSNNNIVYQIRRFSQQFAEEFNSLKEKSKNDHCSHSAGKICPVQNARKCSWSDTPA